MSAPVLEQPRGTMDLPVAETTGGINFLAIVRRRWPWVLVGLFVGIVGGLIAYTSRSKLYNATAKILVIKKRESLGGIDTRMGMMEDYIATQTNIITGESVMRKAAAKAIREVPSYKEADVETTSKVISSLFSVAREKDPGSQVSNNNVVNLTLKGKDADECQKILTLIIEAYKDELLTIYGEATKDKLELINKAMERSASDKKVYVDELDKCTKSIGLKTRELPEAIQNRYSKNIEMLQAYTTEDTELKNNLSEINDTLKSADRGKRQELYIRIQPYIRGIQIPNFNSNYNPADPANQRRELLVIMKETSKKLGPDHPTMQGLQGKLDYLENECRRMNPSDPFGEKDGLEQLAKILETRQKTIKEVMNKLDAQIISDSGVLKDVIPLKNHADKLIDSIKDLEKQYRIYDQDKMQTELTQLSGGYQAKELITPTRVPEPISPRLPENLLLGMAVGILFGIGLAALAEISDKGFRSPADIRARLGLPVLGHIPPIRTSAAVEEQMDLEPTVVTALRPKSVEAEAYRGVRTALYFNAAGSTHQMIQVTSPNQGDGKSTLAANLAVSIAQSGKRTLLVDCDMRRPRVHRVFHLADPGPGLAAVIQGGVPLSAAIQRTAVENLSLLPCGKKPGNPAELLTSPNFSDLLDRLKSDFDFVILDTPPVLAVSDPSAVAPRADGVILVFRMTSRVRPLAERAREQLTQIGANIIGVVVNGSGRGSDGGGYGYGGEYTGYTSSGQYMDNYSDDEDEAPPPKG